MIDAISKSQVSKLLEISSGPCVSIFMPTHRGGPETLQDPIRLKNLLRDITQRLTTDGLRSTEIKKLLAPVNNLLNDSQFWQYQCDGLALFLSPGLFRSYRLPVEFQELSVVSDHFHLGPILPLFTSEDRFYVLALSQNQVRFFQGSRNKISEQSLEGVPQSLSEALGGAQPDMHLQYHTAAATGAGRLPAIYHGREVEVASDSNLQLYFREIDRGLCALLEGQAPLILATVESLVPVYRQVNHYPFLAEQYVPGNPDHSRQEDLHLQAWPIAEAYFQKAQEQAATQCREFQGTPRASSDLGEIIFAARDGRIATLFVTAGVQRWGKLDWKARQLELREAPLTGDEDLVNTAVTLTYATGGKVFAVSANRMPVPETAAAVFRY
jgi:predicted transcriptional regulator